MNTNLTQRVIDVLKALAKHSDQGGRLLDIAEEASMPRPTTHRILHELIETGFVERRPSRRYGLGREVSLLGMSAPPPVQDFDALERIAKRLAKDHGDTVYVAIRKFNTVHYLVRAQGTYPIHAYPVETGETLPIGSTHAGIALIAGLPLHERHALLTPENLLRNRQGEPGRDIDIVAETKRMVESTIQNGYFFAQDLAADEVSGLAAIVPSIHGSPFIAISISTINSRLPETRAQSISRDILAAAKEISRHINSSEF